MLKKNSKNFLYKTSRRQTPQSFPLPFKAYSPFSPLPLLEGVRGRGSGTIEIEFILNTLRDEDKEELEHLFGADWKQKTIEQLRDEKFLVLYGNCGNEGRKPIAMGGFYEINSAFLNGASSLTSSAEASSLIPSSLERASSLTSSPLAGASSLIPPPLEGAELRTDKVRLAKAEMTTAEGEGMTGLSESNYKTGGQGEGYTKPKIACVWLLTSKYVKHNKTALMRALRNELYTKGAEYDILYNFIYKSNHQAKCWLKKLGFSFNNPKPAGMNVQEGFEFFYKNLRYYYVNSCRQRQIQSKRSNRKSGKYLDEYLNRGKE